LRLNTLKFVDDLVFRAFFGSERLSSSLKGFLNSILREARLTQARSLTIKNPFLLETWENQKEPILDIRVIDEEGREYDVEMQCRREEYYIGRVVSYTFRLHAEQLKRGDQYESLKRTVGISLTTFPIDPKRPDLWFDVWKYHSVLDSGLGYDDAVNIFVRIPSRRGENPVGVKDPELLNWIKLLAFYPNLSDEEIATIKESTFGATELLQEAEMFVGTQQEHELMQARERYWHDQASKNAGYEKRINVLTSINSSLTAKNSSLTAENSSLTAGLRNMELELRSVTSKLRSDKLNAERKSIARMLRVRFNAPVASSLERLNRIDSLENLEILSDFSADCKDYNEFLEKLESYSAES